MDLRILPLDKQHDRKTFQCGEPSLDGYLHRYASKDIRRRVNRVFVATTVAKPDRIIAYYSLSAGSLDAEALPQAYRRRLPRYPVPVGGQRASLVEWHELPPERADLSQMLGLITEL